MKQIPMGTHHDDDRAGQGAGYDVLGSTATNVGGWLQDGSSW